MNLTPSERREFNIILKEDDLAFRYFDYLIKQLASIKKMEAAIKDIRMSQYIEPKGQLISYANSFRWAIFEIARDMSHYKKMGNNRNYYAARDRLRAENPLFRIKKHEIQSILSSLKKPHPKLRLAQRRKSRR